MRKILFVTLILLAISGGFILGVYMIPEKKVVEIRPYSLAGKTLFSMVNEHRAKSNNPPLEWSEKLCDIAYKRVQEIKEDYSHEGFYKLIKNNSNYPFMVTENLGTGTGNISNQGIVDSWLDSPPHRHTIEAPWKYTCVATSDNYAVQIFSSFDKIDHNKI